MKLLTPRYREWLTRDVTYIISNQEKTAFLQLPSDEARDQFIERFWEVRNPAPGSPDNAYKAEHYRRLQYANDYFGHVSHTEGWRTDMGRVYITLGEPSQRQKLFGLQKVTPMEIWFYSNANQALPPFFYVIFYQREATDDFRLYSPSSDGPEKLITAQVGPTRSGALKILTDDAGRDVARETLSLIPDEPVDMNSGTVSLASDVMLGTIKNLANNPISQQDLANRRRILEDVSHRIVLGSDYLNVLAIPLRDPEGNIDLHYVLRTTKPEDFTVAQGSKGDYYYSLLVSINVSTAEGKLIFSQEKKVSKNVSKDLFDKIKGQIFGYEGRLPLPPNKYKLEFQLTNLINHTAFRRELEVEIPRVKFDEVQVTNPVAFTEAIMLPPNESKTAPFSGGGVKFTPMIGQELQLNQGQSLNFFYQIWDIPGLRSPHSGKKLEVEYVYGRIGARDTQTVHDEISLDQLDPAGSLLNGKRILTGELSPGNYRLVLALHDPGVDTKVYGSLNFGVYSTTTPPAWDIQDDGLSDDIRNGTSDNQRASCYFAFGDNAHALEWFRRAYSKNPADEKFRARLVDLYFAQKAYANVAELYANGGINQSTDEQTVLKMAESLDKGGDLKRAVAVMESGTNFHPSSGPLFIGLADYYRKSGDDQKAAAAERKGKQFLATPPTS